MTGLNVTLHGINVTYHGHTYRLEYYEETKTWAAWSEKDGVSTVVVAAKTLHTVCHQLSTAA